MYKIQQVLKLFWTQTTSFIQEVEKPTIFMYGACVNGTGNNKVTLANSEIERDKLQISLSKRTYLFIYLYLSD